MALVQWCRGAFYLSDTMSHDRQQVLSKVLSNREEIHGSNNACMASLRGQEAWRSNNRIPRPTTVANLTFSTSVQSTAFTFFYRV